MSVAALGPIVAARRGRGRRRRDADPRARGGRTRARRPDRSPTRLEMRGDAVHVLSRRRHLPRRAVARRGTAAPARRGGAAVAGPAARPRSRRSARSGSRSPKRAAARTCRGTRRSRLWLMAAAMRRSASSPTAARWRRVRCARATWRARALSARQSAGLVLGLPTGRTPIPLYRELVRLYRAGRVDFAAHHVQPRRVPSGSRRRSAAAIARSCSAICSTT